MRLTRLITHGLLLAVAASIAGIRFFDKGFTGPHLAPSSVNAASAGDPSAGGSRAGTIIKPLEIPMAPVLPHAAVHDTVRAGDTVASIAQQHGIPEESVRWSNLSTLSRVGSEPAVGADLLLPPVAGVALVSIAGDTFTNLANRYHVDAQSVVDFNRLRFAADDPLPAGLELVVPAGRGPDLAPATQSSRPAAEFRGRGYTLLGPGPIVPVAAGNRFAFGNCTYYVYNRRQIPWQGDAWAWYGNAQAMGFATGRTPRPGSIMVTWESGYGHVAYVESVNPDGSWVVAEMNWVAFNTVDRRLIHPGGVPLIGFIY
ncbi:MAG TPA: CHAP domain-containing protein [Candidatus Dormibacteraeota bacterium]|nr:CHAP domain-containing protein [Candidatus Dormibacteraeota bacterium]